MTQWTWVWVNSGSWWWTGRPGMLRSWGHKEWDTTERLNWTELKFNCSVHFHWLNLANLATFQDFHLPVLQIRFLLLQILYVIRDLLCTSSLSWNVQNFHWGGGERLLKVERAGSSISAEELVWSEFLTNKTRMSSPWVLQTIQLLKRSKAPYLDTLLPWPLDDLLRQRIHRPYDLKDENKQDN